MLIDEADKLNEAAKSDPTYNTAGGFLKLLKTSTPPTLESP